MLEMACVSFNRVRLQYYVSKKNRRAIWLSALLKNPARLFGTTLIGVTTALQFGSECARRFYISLDLSPDWAPLSQVIIVLIFAELAPLFAARRYAENVVMLGIPIVYFTSIIMTPITYCLDLICRFVHLFFGGRATPGLVLSREELQKAIEERENIPATANAEVFDPILMNIFSLKTKTAGDLMIPIQEIKTLSSEGTLSELHALLRGETSPFVPIYHRTKQNIVAIAYPRDLLRFSDETRVRPYSRSPWFITEKNSVLQIIKEFRRNNQSLAVVLNEGGIAIGILTLDAVVDEVFGSREDWISLGEFSKEKHLVMIERSFPGDTKVSLINKWIGIHLEGGEDETLEDLMTKNLGHRPSVGESVRIDNFDLTLEQSSLIAGKTILICSVF